MTPDIRVDTYDGPDVALTGELRELYGPVYAGPPYHDGPEDLAEFVAEWPDMTARPGFRLALARIDGAAAGFALGHVVGRTARGGRSTGSGSTRGRTPPG